MSTLSYMLGWLRLWFHCLRGMLSGHRMVRWGDRSGPLGIGCECGVVFWWRPRDPQEGGR